MIANSVEWVQTNFGKAELGDKRRTKRLVTFVTDLVSNIGMSVVKSSQTSDKIEAAYRLIRNNNVKSQDIETSAFNATAELVNEYDLLLALEDTTSLNFSYKSVNSELGPLGHSTKARGILAHSVLLFAPNEQNVVGLIEQQRWCRELASHGRGDHHLTYKYEDKESFKWQRASLHVAKRLGKNMDKVISVCDREADIYEYLRYKTQNNHRFVVRSMQSRRILEGANKLYSFSENLISVGQRTICISQRGSTNNSAARKKRLVSCEIKYSPVTLKVPGNKSGNFEDISLYYVGCHEKSKGVKTPLRWHLLTSEKVVNADDAKRVIEFYEKRWLIEDFHKAWKSGGTKVESLRMQTKESLEKMAVIFAFIAVRIQQLRYMGLNEVKAKDTSCETLLTPLEWKLLWIKVEGIKPPEITPNIHWAYTRLGLLAGWNDSKQTGRIGWITLWEGWFKLQTLVEGYRLTQRFIIDL
ncbi:IS4 family transposase [Shewanella sp.]|uniref:IS4 family transposase n=1 Tax=Shewanella sp. TaxID=50422 RepID=UPI003A89BAD5